jgi:hypothetical protein
VRSLRHGYLLLYKFDMFGSTTSIEFACLRNKGCLLNGMAADWMGAKPPVILSDVPKGRTKYLYLRKARPSRSKALLHNYSIRKQSFRQQRSQVELGSEKKNAVWPIQGNALLLLREPLTFVYTIPRVTGIAPEYK